MAAGLATSVATFGSSLIRSSHLLSLMQAFLAGGLEHGWKFLEVATLLRPPACNCNPTLHCPSIPHCQCASEQTRCPPCYPAQGSATVIIACFVAGALFGVGIAFAAFRFTRTPTPVEVVDRTASAPAFQRVPIRIEDLSPPPDLAAQAAAQVREIRSRHGAPMR